VESGHCARYLFRVDGAAIFQQAINFLRQHESVDDAPKLPPLSQSSAASAATGAKLYDELAVLLAQRYASGELSFEEADYLANQWWGMMLKGDEWSDLYYEVYEAFDAGETREADVQERTDPAIRKIVARFNKTD